MKRVAVVGAGWSGVAAARHLHDGGWHVEVFEATGVAGGHSRVERLNGVIYEPHGPHIFHTSSPRVADFVQRFGLTRRYEHRPLTELRVDGQPRYYSWPLRLEELSTLPQWDRVRRELRDRPPTPAGGDFESYCVALLGETLYRLFVYHYTVKQWGAEPRALDAAVAARRIQLRTNGAHGLFQDPWQYFPAEGANPVIERVLTGIPVHLHTEVRLLDLVDHLYRSFDHVVCTAPLDGFVGDAPPLPWRGIQVHARYHETASLDATFTRGYVINQPDPGVPFTRLVETKHATGQSVRGTVVCEEHPGYPAKHYPVPTPDGRNERQNLLLQERIGRLSPVPVSFCGRLANYQYINQDEAILQGLRAADALLGP